MVAVHGVGAETFRHVLGHLPTGACVITTVDARGEPLGLTCNSFTSVSLSPPLVSFCPAKASTTWPRMRPSGRFGVNVLAADQDAVCRLFALRGAKRFDSIDWRPSATGNPLLDGALAWMDCEIVAEHDAGDHTIVVGAVQALDRSREHGPLIVFRGGYGRLMTDD